jgi:hypothetical protein
VRLILQFATAALVLTTATPKLVAAGFPSRQVWPQVRKLANVRPRATTSLLPIRPCITVAASALGSRASATWH